MKLIDYRSVKRIPLEVAAAQLKIDPSYVWRLEHHQRRASPEIAARIEAWSGGWVTRLEILYPGVSDDKKDKGRSKIHRGKK